MKRINLYVLAIIIAFLFSTGQITAQFRLLSIGDSTMADYDEEKNSGENEMRGWMQMMTVFLRSDVVLNNAAMNGRSSKSFYYEFWNDLRETINPGDYVFIQFGHNDEKLNGLDSEGHGADKRGTAAWGQYQEYLTKYVNDSRERGAHPVLLTPVVRGGMDANGKLLAKSLHSLSELCGNDSLMNYPLAMRSLTKDLNVPLIDMTSMTKILVEEYGYEKAKKYIYCEKDDTHLKVTGGVLFANLAVKELMRQGILTDAFIPDSVDYNCNLAK